MNDGQRPEAGNDRPTFAGTSTPGASALFARRVVDRDAFDSFVSLVLVANAMMLVAESLMELAAHDDVLWWFYSLSTAVFVIEIALRIVAHGPRYRSFFADPWNVFDFVVTLVSVLPMLGSAGFVGRFARFVRFARFARFARLLSIGRRRTDGRGAP
jgi:voltage-gated sodium channel